MIDFRYHLVSIIAVFMALAVGIVVGSGPLKDPIDNAIQSEVDQLRNEKEDAQTRQADLEDELRYSNEIADQLNPQLSGAGLAGRRVLLVSLPGTATSLVDDLEATVTKAGATVSGTVGITDAWSDPEGAAALDAVVTDEDTIPPGFTFPVDGSATDRAAAVLASAVLTRESAVAGTPDEDAATVLAALGELGVVTVEGSPSERASVALVVAPAPPAQDDDGSSAVTSAQVRLATALDDAGLGTVVAGASPSAGSGGLVAATREDDSASASVSTVDAAQLEWGRVAAAMALVSEASGTTGSYGYGDGADLLLPAEPLPAATPSPAPS